MEETQPTFADELRGIQHSEKPTLSKEESYEIFRKYVKKRG